MFCSCSTNRKTRKFKPTASFALDSLPSSLADEEPSDFMVFDPVSAELIITGEAFAEENGLYFSSEDTLQTYRQLLEQGFEVDIDFNGRPRIRKRTQSRTPGSVDRSMDLFKETGLFETSLSLHRDADLVACRLRTRRNTRERELAVELRKGPGGVLGMTLGWDRMNKCCVVKSVQPQGGPALSTGKIFVGDRIRGVQGSRIATLSFREIIQEIRCANNVLHIIVENPNWSSNTYYTFCVTLSRHPDGSLGLQLGWNPQTQKCFIKENMANIENIIKGDLLLGVQGERTDSLSFFEVVDLLKNASVPILVFGRRNEGSETSKDSDNPSPKESKASSDVFNRVIDASDGPASKLTPIAVSNSMVVSRMSPENESKSKSNIIKEQIDPQLKPLSSALLLARMNSKTSKVSTLIESHIAKEQIDPQLKPLSSALLLAITNSKTSKVSTPIESYIVKEQIDPQLKPLSSALLLAITNSKTSKVATPIEKKIASDLEPQMQVSFLDAIACGVKLKPVTPRKKLNRPMNGSMRSLSEALDSRRAQLQVSDVSDDEDW